MTNTRLTDPEVLEWRFPVLLESFSIRSGIRWGRGRHRGGDGAVRRVRFGEAMELNVIAGHRRIAPLRHGRGPAGRRPDINRVIRADGTDGGAVPAVTGPMSIPGDVFEIHTPGGGGFGPADAPTLRKARKR